MSALTFAREFVRDPVTLGAVAPSGRALARLTVASADIRPDHVVVELGAGTGPMTREILARHPDNPFVALEPNGELARLLHLAHPEAKVEQRFAEDLPQILTEWGHPVAHRVVSSLPWAIWSEALQDRTFDAIVEALHPEGRMVTFAYVHAQVLPAARRLREQLRRRFRSVTRTRVAWANLPPAFVFVCDGPRGDPRGISRTAPGSTGR